MYEGKKSLQTPSRHKYNTHSKTFEPRSLNSRSCVNVRVIVVVKSSRHAALQTLNPVSRSINMHILLTVSHMFHMVPVGRICTNIKTLMFGDHFLYSRNLYVTLGARGFSCPVSLGLRPISPDASEKETSDTQGTCTFDQVGIL